MVQVGVSARLNISGVHFVVALVSPLSANFVSLRFLEQILVALSSRWKSELSLKTGRHFESRAGNSIQ